MKKLAAVLAVLLLSTLLFAASYDEILSKSMANSPQMKNAELTYQNSLLTQQQNDLSDVAQVTVSTGTISVLPNENSSTTVGDQSELYRLFCLISIAGSMSKNLVQSFLDL